MHAVTIVTTSFKNTAQFKFEVSALNEFSFGHEVMGMCRGGTKPSNLNLKSELSVRDFYFWDGVGE